MHWILSAYVVDMGKFLQLLLSFACLFPLVTSLTRSEASRLLEERILPASEYAKRTGLGRQAQGVQVADLVQGNDVRLYQTYGEFPLQSFDSLLDLTVAHFKQPKKRLRVLDLGSGCGRLVFYIGLTRPHWIVQGIELSSVLHEEALRARMRLQQVVDQDTTVTQMELFCGPASSFTDVIRQADVIFCYSTAFESDGFSTETGTMVLAQEWNDLFAKSCSEDCLVITTDKSLDMRWKILDRLDVENREVCESTGFVHRLAQPSLCRNN